MTVLDLVDEAGIPVVLWGAVPPEGRDYDVICRGADLSPLEQRLQGAGFLRRSPTRWVRIEEMSVEVVDLFTLRAFGVADEEVEELFDQATPVSGRRQVLRPSPAHELLLLTLKAVPGEPLPRQRRQRVDAALRADRDGWEHAWDIGVRWGVADDLELLKMAWRTGLPFAKKEPGERGWRRRRQQGRDALVVSFSGLDGSGKSLQARLVREALETLGHETVIEWARLGESPALAVMGAPVKAILRLGVRRRPAAADAAREQAQADLAEPVASPGPDAATRLRTRSRLVGATWATIVTAANAATYRRAVRRHTRHGRSVVLDRYLLDSEVHLAFRYAGDREMGLQRRILRLLVPRPDVAYLLDVRPETALARKSDQFSVAELERQASLYRADADQLGVRVLDGERPAEQIFRTVMGDLLDRL